MTPPPAPIRFLAIAVGGWVAFRTIVWLPVWTEAAPIQDAETPPWLAQAEPAPSEPPQAKSNGANAFAEVDYVAIRSTERLPLGWRAAPALREPYNVPLISTAFAQARLPPALPTTRPPFAAPPQPLAYPPLPAVAAPATAPPQAARWSGSAWLLLRDDGAGTLAPGGTLGGSQAGLRLAYRLNVDARRPLSIAGRLYAPLASPGGSEAAIGLDWQPVASLPLHILAERRQRIGNDGRSDFGLTVYGGIDRRLLSGRVRVEAYAQAGIVGLEERDLFADGSVRASVRVGPIDVGGGAWGGAQPGLSRLDIGPQASVRLPVAGANVRASAEWRFRIAGEAAPGSGPALTIATDF